MNALHVPFVFLEEKLLNLKGACSALFFCFAYKYESRQIIATYQIQGGQRLLCALVVKNLTSKHRNKLCAVDILVSYSPTVKCVD